jgi:succinate-semialdehyde dehydrogenase/glutarate-semialdehyde dehydrogenase
MSFTATNPATGKVVAEFDGHSPAQVDDALGVASSAFHVWKNTPVKERAQLMLRAAELLEGEIPTIGELMTSEMGKTFNAAKGEAAKCAATMRYYAEHAEGMLQDEIVSTKGSLSGYRFDPIGAVLAVMPWNFPLWQVFRFAAPALMAGNTGLLKHASNVSGCALAIEELLHAAGVPRGAFRALLVGSARVGALVEAPEVVAVTLTGSTPAGRAVAAKAGACLKKSLLELGGSDAYLVLDDADLDAAAEVCAAARLVNAGQSCIGAKRFVVVEPVRHAFEERLVERMRARRVGDPLADGVEVGPLARLDLRDAVHEQLRASVARGARLLLGGERPGGPGAFYPPSVLADVRPGMPAFDEELFGPVAAVVPAQNEQDAVRLANRSAFGLGAAVFTRDLARGERLARHELLAGSCFVNGLVKSDPRLPFGGIKESGYGRELGAFGIREFVNVKTVWIA